MTKNTRVLLLTTVVAIFAFGTVQASEKHNHSGHHHHGAHEHKEETQQKKTEGKPSVEAPHSSVSQKTTEHKEHHNHDGHGHDHAQTDKPYYGHLDVKIHADNVFKAGEADEEIKEVYAHSHLELGARLGHGLSLNTNILLEGEPSGHDHGGGGSAPNGRDRIFKDHPLLVERLTLNYDNDMVSFYGGKFNPAVGFHHERFAGLYTYQTIEEYAIRERIGLGAAIKKNGGDLGHHRLDVSTFFADTTFLSNSLLYERGRTHKSSGGLANTEDFSSYAVSLGGEAIMLDPRYNGQAAYRFGYAKQAKGNNNDNDETRYSASLGYSTELTPELRAILLGEHVQIDHLGGEAAHDRSVTTGLLRFEYQQWNLSGSYTYIHNDAGDPAEGAEGNVTQISAGYKFMNGIGIDIGYQRSDEEQEVKKKVGALVSYSTSF